MLKLTGAVLAFALAGSASAAGWRKLQIDASSEAAFDQSVATFQQKLSPSRRAAFARSLQDIRLQYTDADFLRQIHGLGYEQIVTLMDPTGKKEGQYRAEYYRYSRPRPIPETDPRIALQPGAFPTGPIVSSDQYVRSKSRKSRWCTLRPSC